MFRDKRGLQACEGCKREKTTSQMIAFFFAGVGHPARFSSLFTWGPEEVFLPLQRLRSSHRPAFLDCLLSVLIFFWSFSLLFSLLFSQCLACRPFDRLFLLFVLRVPHGQLFQTFLSLFYS